MSSLYVSWDKKKEIDPSYMVHVLSMQKVMASPFLSRYKDKLLNPLRASIILMFFVKKASDINMARIPLDNLKSIR